MGTLQIVGIDKAKVFTAGGFDIALINEVSYARQQLALLIHICRLVHRAGKHKLDMQGLAFGF